ncbi:MAG: hypothetical protein ACXWUG_18485 [Polyangiales bacterium]
MSEDEGPRRLRLPLQTGRAAIDAAATASVCLALAVPMLFVGTLTFMSGLFWLVWNGDWIYFDAGGAIYRLKP